jgi:DNA polymerase III epsilon subunit-like protein
MTKPQCICFTDTETTGLDPYDDEIIQIAAIKVMHHPEDPAKVVRLDNCTMELKIKPTKPVPPEVAKLNGYDPEVWEKEAVSLEEAMEKYEKFVMWTNFGGQNPAFDKAFIMQAFKKCGIDWPRMQGYRLIATEMLAWPLLLTGKIPNVKQETLVNYFKLGKQTHDALDDVEQCVEIYTRLIAEAVKQQA